MSSVTTRVLVLHGYAQNAHIFSRRLGALRKQAKDVEMVFLDAPHILQPVDLFGPPSELGAEEASTEDPLLRPRGWWKFSDKAKTAPVGMDDTLIFIRDTLKASKFDGILGFSQGAGLAALVAALLERPELYPPFLIDGQPPHPPFKFCVSVSGFKPSDPLSDKVLSPGYSTPTLHILGKNDIVVTPERSKSLLNVSLVQRVEEHDGGHFVPSKTPWRKFLATYLANPSGDIPSPSGASASGTATPVTTDEPAVAV